MKYLILIAAAIATAPAQASSSYEVRLEQERAMVQENMLSRYPDAALEAVVHDLGKGQWYALASNGCLYGFTPVYGSTEAEGLQRLDADFYGCERAVNGTGKKLFRALFK